MKNVKNVLVSGAEPGSKPKKCSTCDGHGKVRTQQGFFTLTTNMS
jgi:molecular chaperone DnaJ